MPLKKPTISAIVAGGLALTLAACATDEELDPGAYPTDDVTIFVPYAAGGSTDALARATAEALGQEFDGNFVIENQPGAGGTRALSNLVDGPTDGTELAILASPTFLIPAAQGQVDYELEDLRPVGQLAEQPIVLLERGDES